MSAALTMMVEHANCGRTFPDEAFRGFLADGMPDAVTYRYEPPPGAIVAALDWQALVGTGADLIAYAGLVWAAYERFVRPYRDRRRRSGRDAFLIVNVNRQDGSFAQFAIGRQYLDREDFVQRFVSEVAALRAGDGPSVEALAAELDASEGWVRITRESDGRS
jgi:hypothetical protein